MGVSWLSAVIGAVGALAGVSLKMVYDSVVAKRQRERDDSHSMLSERRQVFDELLDASKRLRLFQEKLHDVLLRHERGDDASEAERNSFPPSPMEELVGALERVRRLARTHDVIRAGERIVALHVDISALDRVRLEAGPTQDADISYWLLGIFLQDREHEFVHAYRAELGIGPPVGGPADYPKTPKAIPTYVGEDVIRAHTRWVRHWYERERARERSADSPPSD